MRSALIVGGNGALGRSAIEVFRNQGFRTVSVDFADSELASRSIRLPSASWGEQLASIEKDLKDETFDVAFCAAGGWTGLSILADTASLVASVDRMLSFNLHSAIQTARLGAQFLKPGGLLVLTGAAAALGPTGGMLAYGISKAGTHHLASSIVDDFAKTGKVKGRVTLEMRKSLTFDVKCVLTLLPITLDTPANRSSMPNADFSSWTPVSFVARTILDWVLADARPKSGSMFRLLTENNVSRLEKVE